MVGCWFFGLEVIPDDRGRSAQGPPRVFGPKILIFALPRGPGPLAPRGFFAFVRMCPHTNGWAPYVAPVDGHPWW